MKPLYGAVQHRIPRIEHGTRSSTAGIIVHDTEGGSIASTESWFRQDPAALGAHFGIDAGTLRTPPVLQWADTDALVWHAAGANHNHIGIELAGHASDSRAKWLLKRGQRIALAETLARLCHAYGLGEPRRGRNVFGHADFPAGGHHDPGPNFPWDAVMALATKRYREFYG